MFKTILKPTNNNCDVARDKGDFVYASNVEFNTRAFSKLQNTILFIEIDQCNQLL